VVTVVIMVTVVTVVTVVIMVTVVTVVTVVIGDLPGYFQGFVFRVRIGLVIVIVVAGAVAHGGVLSFSCRSGPCFGRRRLEPQTPEQGHGLC